jgi:hypothetical protein
MAEKADGVKIIGKRFFCFDCSNQCVLIMIDEAEILIPFRCPWNYKDVFKNNWKEV